MIKATNLIQTGIAWIPEIPSDWELKRIKLLFDFNKNIVGKTSADYDVLSLTTKGVIKRDLESGMGKFPASFDGYQIVKPNSIMLCLFDMDVTPRVVGHVDDDGIISAAYTNIIPKKGINSKYYYYYFLLQDKNKSLLALGTGIRITLNKDFFGTLKIPVPPIEVQNSIVAYLDKKNTEIDKFIRNKERLVELLEEQKKSIVFEECKEYFKTHKKKVKFVVKICNGLEQKAVEDINGEYPIYGSGGVIGYANKYLHNKTSVLLGRKGTIDKPIFVTEPFWSIDTAFYTIINERKIIPKFFFYACSFINFDEYKYGSAIPSMTQGMLNNIEIPFPGLEKQKELVEIIEFQLSKINLAISKAQKEISAIKEYREALITDLVTGKRSVPQLQKL